MFEAVRGTGLMLGLKCRPAPADVVKAGYAQGVLAVPAADNVVRLLPPLNIPDEDLAEARATPRRRRRLALILSLARNYPRGSGGRQPPGPPPRDRAMNHFLDIDKTAPADLRAMIDHARAMKDARAGRPKGTPDDEQPLAGRMVALIFEKPSTRTRVSFDVGVRQMGGQTMVLSGADMQLGHGETIADTARVLSRYVDLIMIRTFEEAVLLEMAENATVPVINGLTNRTHPCQIMADVMTYEEHRGPIAGAQGGLVRRRQQRLRLLGAGGGAVRLRPHLHRPADARPRARRTSTSPARRARASRSSATPIRR